MSQVKPRPAHGRHIESANKYKLAYGRAARSKGRQLTRLGVAEPLDMLCCGVVLACAFSIHGHTFRVAPDQWFDA